MSGYGASVHRGCGPARPRPRRAGADRAHPSQGRRRGPRRTGPARGPDLHRGGARRPVPAARRRRRRHRRDHRGADRDRVRRVVRHGAGHRHRDRAATAHRPVRRRPRRHRLPGDPVALDVMTMGRVGVDIYPLQVGVGLEDVETFGKYLGGSPSNVAVAAARYGRAVAVITRTGADPFGRFIHKALAGYGVDDRFVTDVPGLPTPVTFCEIFPPDHFPIYFYRLPTAPDLEIAAGELDFDAIRSAKVFWATVTGLC